ncbi:N-acetyltransferase [candidate division WOR-3 bacterium]|nr:N-acetyltransferase [candidate division WOR-3 bacterium]
MISVISVKTEKELKTFVNYPYQLYKENRYWIPPLKQDVYHLFDKNKNPFWEHAEREMFLAYRNKNIAGRICAIVDYNYIEFWNEKTGYFGFFECDDDEDAARAMFDHVRLFHKDKGMTKFIGPVNPSTNDECGLLIEGFYSPPFIMMLHNYEYYSQLCEKAGLIKAKDLNAFYVDSKDAPLEYLERLCSIVRRRIQDIKVRPVNLNDFANEVKKIKEVYNDAWSRNWGFVPVTDAEFDALAKKLKPLVIPELVTIIEIDNVPVAISLTLPNYNVVLKKLNGRLGPIEMLKFLYYKRKIKEGRLMIMGVRKKYRKMGLESLLFFESFRAAQKLGYIGGELSWTLEDNHSTNNTIIKMGGKIYKKYRIYEGQV